MKKIFITFAAAASMIAAFAGPPMPRGHMPHHSPRLYGPRASHPALIHHIPPPRPHHSGRSAAVGIGIGLGLSFLSPYISVPPPPPPLPRPYVRHQLVWITPMYMTRPVYDTFGNIVRYEQVLIRAGYWR